MKIQTVGHMNGYDCFEIVLGSVAERKLCALYGKRGRLVGAVAVNMPRQVPQWTRRLDDGILWEDALQAVEGL